MGPLESRGQRESDAAIATSIRPSRADLQCLQKGHLRSSSTSSQRGHRSAAAGKLYCDPSWKSTGSVGDRRSLLLRRHGAANVVAPLNSVHARRPSTATPVASASVPAKPRAPALILPPLGAYSGGPAALRGRVGEVVHYLSPGRDYIRKSQSLRQQSW